MKRDAGLTLLELLVAMTLLALISTLAAGGIRFGTVAWERSSDATERTLEAHALERFFRRQIGAAHPIQVADGTRTPPVVFSGSETSISFLAPIQAALAPPGLHFIQIGNGQQDFEGQVLLLWSPVGRDQIASDDSPKVEVLGSRLGQITFRFFGPGEDGKEVWQDVWENRQSLPRMVELRFSSDTPSDRELSLIIALE